LHSGKDLAVSLRSFIIEFNQEIILGHLKIFILRRHCSHLSFLKKGWVLPTTLLPENQGSVRTFLFLKKKAIALLFGHINHIKKE